MTFISFVSCLLRGNPSIAGPSMVANLQLTEIQWGWLMAETPLVLVIDALPPCATYGLTNTGANLMGFVSAF